MKYQMIRIPSIYDSIQDTLTQNLFSKIVEFKINGYLKEYPYGTLPLDSADFFASHLLIKNTENDKIIIGMKSVTYNKCEIHKTKFPMFGMLESIDDTSKHLSVLKDIITSHQINQSTDKLAYNGSYTVCPETRANKEEMKTVWEMSQAMMVNHYLEEKTKQVIAICSKQFKIDKVKKNLGWDYFYFDNSALDEYQCMSLANALFLPMTVTQHSEFALNLANQYKSMWDCRLEPKVSVVDIKKAA